MSRTEDRIREALAERAGLPPTTTMAPSVRRRVRLRQAGLAAALGSVAALAIAFAVFAYGTALTPRPDPTSTFDPAADGYTSPLEDVPPQWPAVDIRDPASAYVPSPNGEPNVTEGPVVLASGTVKGSSFTLYAYTLGRGADATPCLGFVGFAPAGQNTKAAPEAGTCANDPAVPQRQDVAFIGAGAAGVPGLEANFGFVSDRVDDIYVWGGGHLGMFEIPRLPRLDGWEASPFFFVPAPNAGPLEVSTRVNGGVVPLAHADICLPADVSGTCRTTVRQDLPISSPVDVPLPLAAGGWPRVTHGGDFEPYVDHEANVDGVVDPGVIGEKTVIAYGTVQGAPWSLVAYNIRYPGAPGDVSPANDLFVTGVGGSSGATLFETTPWSPNDLAAGRMHGDGEGFDSIDGIVSMRVDAVRLELSDGTVQDVMLIPGPPGVDARYFVLFIPHRAQGRLVALDAAGQEVEQMCLPDMAGVPPDGTTRAQGELDSRLSPCSGSTGVRAGDS
jgi:hypothetical protein